MTQPDKSHSRVVSLRVHLLDASSHLRLAARSLEAAAETASTDNGARQLERLAQSVRGWAQRVDPRNIEKRARRAA